MKQLRPGRRAFSLLDSMLAMLVLSGIAVAAMQAGGASAKAQLAASESQLAGRVAESLLAEVVSRRFGTTTVSAGAARSAYTDILQYATLDEEPTDRGGTKVAGTSGRWRQKVKLDYVLPADRSAVSATPTPLLRITVTVTRDGGTRALRIAYRAKD